MVSSTSLADFKQLALLGEGAYSAVYKVLRLADHEIYALKKVKLPSLSDKEKQNALNEVRLLASVTNDYIIAYKEAFFDDKTKCLCIVQECADAGDLLQMINRCKQERAYIREADIWRYLDGMTRGLKALHDFKILHRDMKCANVFLSASRDGTIAKLGDFNVSKVAKRGLCMTQTGTPYYASPEVWRDMPYDGKSDMWSLGCVLYEMVALRPPFRAEDMEGLYRKVVRGQYPRIPAHYSQDLSDVIAGLLQVHPRHRPSVEQLLAMPAMGRNTATTALKDEFIGNPADLLATIKLPKNVIDLSICLPAARYARSDDLGSVDHSAVHESVNRDRNPSSPGSVVGSDAHIPAAASQPRRQQLASDASSQGGGGPPLPRAAPRATGSRGRLQPAADLAAANMGRYSQDNSDADVPHVQKQSAVPPYSEVATPVRGQAVQAVPDSLDAYLQQHKDPPDYNDNSRPSAEYQAPVNKGDAYPHAQGQPVQQYAQVRTGEGTRAYNNNAAAASINPRYNPSAAAQGPGGGSRPPRAEARRPMSIYARQQYAVVEQSQQPQQQQQQIPQQQVVAQKETPEGGRRKRSIIPRLF